MDNTIKMPLSFTNIKLFEQCPQRFYQEKVLKKIPYVKSPQAERGDTIHKELEAYMVDGTPLNVARPFSAWVETFSSQPGDKYMEHKMAMNWVGRPVSYFRGRDIWIRGQFDLMIANGETAVMVDYKTGKSKYADLGQLELMSLLTFIHFPKIQSITGALVFLDEDKIIKDTYLQENVSRYRERWMQRSIPITTSLTTRKFPMKPSGLCAYCPVIDCPHYKGE